MPALPNPSAGAVIIGARCHYCSKHRNPNDVLTLPGGNVMCHSCYHWHRKAMEKLSTGEPPERCQQCLTPWEDLEHRHARKGGNVPMVLVVKDGMYQFLCLDCAPVYVQKRADLYGETKWGHQQKLKVKT